MKIVTDVGKVLTDYNKDKTITDKLINVNNSLETLVKWKSLQIEIYICSFCLEKQAYKRTNKLKTDGDDEIFVNEYYIDDKLYKADIISLINGDIMIDDNEEVLNRIKEKCPNIITILFQEFNKLKKKSHKKHIIVNNWKELDKFIDKILLTNFEKKASQSIYELVSNGYNIKELNDKAYFIEKN
jgi:hypothetical protein